MNLTNLIKKNYWVVVFAFFIIILILFTQSFINSTNPASRFLTMESIVERGTFIINEKHIYTDDKMIREGNYYSSKPPVLTVMGSGIYYILHKAFNQRLPQEPYYFTANLSVYIITLILVGIPFLLLLFFFYKTLKILKINSEYQVVLLIGLGLGTLYLTYSITLNNHLPAGAFLFISFYYLLKIKFNQSDNYKKYFFLSGLFASLALVIDLAALFFFILFFFYLIYSFPFKKSIYFISAAAPIFIIHLFFTYHITGDFLPVQFHPEFSNNFSTHQKAVWSQLGGGNEKINRNLFVYIINILFGTHGLFSYSPILLFALYAILKEIKNKLEFRREAILILSGFATVLLFCILKLKVYTGSAFGFRWFIALTPLLYFFNILLFRNRPSRKFMTFFNTALVISVSIALIGFLNPWPNYMVNISTPFPEYPILKLNFPLLNSLIAILNYK